MDAEQCLFAAVILLQLRTRTMMSEMRRNRLTLSAASELLSDRNNFLCQQRILSHGPGLVFDFQCSTSTRCWSHSDYYDDDEDVVAVIRQPQRRSLVRLVNGMDEVSASLSPDRLMLLLRSEWRWPCRRSPCRGFRLSE